MTRLGTRIAAAARPIHAWIRRRHPASKAGFESQMAATFDALLTQAARRGPTAVIRLIVCDLLELLSAIRQPTHESLEPSHPKGRTMIDTLIQDIRYTLRSCRRRPGFTAAVVATLALGIGANTAIFSVVNAVLLQQLPYANPSRLVMVWEDATALGFPRNSPAPGNYADWASAVTAFDGVAAVDNRSFNLTGDDAPERVGGKGVTANFFTVLGVEPRIGRTWTADEDLAGARVAVMSDRLWRRRFGADPDLVNRTIMLNGVAHQVLGVMPPRFQGLSPFTHLWVPVNFTAADLSDRDSHYLSVVARLRDGTSLDQANAELGALATRLQEAFPSTNRSIEMYAVGLLDDHVGDTRAVLVLLLGAVGCVLLVACANVANLLLTRASGQTREMSVRAALGAGRHRLIRQGLTESLLLACAGGALGLGIAAASFGTLTHLIPEPLADLSRVTLDARVFAATAAVTMLTAVLFGLVPAWRASRVNPAGGSTRLGGRGVVAGPGRLGRALVIAEVALASVLLVGAGLLLDSFEAVRDLDRGFRSEDVLTARVVLPRSSYADESRRLQLVTDVLDRVRALPGVENAGFTGAVPLSWKGGTSGFELEGQPRDPALPYDANNRVVSPGYMETLGMTLHSGRFFTSQDDGNGQPVAIINATMAREYWPGVDPIGRRFQAYPDRGAPRWRTIVGIVGDTRVMGLDQPTRPEMYFPIAQSANNWVWPRDLAIKVDGDAMAMGTAIRQIVQAVDPMQPVSNIETLDDIVGAELQGREVQVTLMVAFAGLALVLAVIGVYGVQSYAVSSRTSEIGVRLALGGSPSQVQSLVLLQGLTLTVIGLAIGLVAAVLGATLVERLLFQVSPHDPRAFVTQAIALLLAGTLAAYLPARRASRVNPVTALRGE
jgi:predicted permease